MDVIAAAARLALLGVSTEIAVPFGDLKPEVRERWRGVVKVVQGSFWEELEALRTGWANSHKAEEECERLQEHLQAVKAERDNLRSKILDNTGENNQMAELLSEAWQQLEELGVVPNSLIDAPSGVPSVEELVKIGQRASDDPVGKKSGPLDELVAERNAARATAIRDAVLAGVQRPQDPYSLGQMAKAAAQLSGRRMTPEWWIDTVASIRNWVMGEAEIIGWGDYETKDAEGRG